MRARTTTTADENVSTVVKMLIAGKRGTADELAHFLGISRSTVFEKLNGNRRWYAAEVQGLADYFKAPIDVFYGGTAKLLTISCDYGVTSPIGWPEHPSLFDLHTADSAA